MTDFNTDQNNFSELLKEHTSPMTPYNTEVNSQLKDLTGIRAVFFDVYGTLLISGTGDISISEEKNNQFPISSILQNYGFSIISKKENIDQQFSLLLNRFIKEDHKRYRERGEMFPEVDIIDIWSRILNNLLSESYIDGEITEEKILKSSLMYECMVNPVWPMPGADQLIKYLYNKNYKLGIISNAQFYTEEILKYLLDFQIGKTFFDPALLYYSYREKQAKPSKVFFLKAVTKIKKLYNIDSDEILYIGNDMLNDVFTANQCGCRTALFAGDRRSLRLRLSDERCRNLAPDLVITELGQLTKIL